jgi:hypothetical protein
VRQQTARNAISAISEKSERPSHSDSPKITAATRALTPRAWSSHLHVQETASCAGEDRRALLGFEVGDRSHGLQRIFVSHVERSVGAQDELIYSYGVDQVAKGQGVEGYGVKEQPAEQLGRWGARASAL